MVVAVVVAVVVSGGLYWLVVVVMFWVVYSKQIKRLHQPRNKPSLAPNLLHFPHFPYFPLHHLLLPFLFFFFFFFCKKAPPLARAATLAPSLPTWPWSALLAPPESSAPLEPPSASSVRPASMRPIPGPAAAPLALPEGQWKCVVVVGGWCSWLWWWRGVGGW